MPVGRWSGFGSDLPPQFVLVVALLGAATVEVTENGRQEARLLDELTGAAIDRRPRLEDAQCQPLERVDVLPVAAQVVVEPEHLGDQPGTHPKRRPDAVGDDGPAGDAKQHFAFLARQLRPGERQPVGEAPDNLGRRRKVRKNGGRWGRGLDPSDEMLGRGSRRNDDQAVTRVKRRPLDGQRCRRLAKRLETPYPHQARHAGCNH